MKNTKLLSSILNFKQSSGIEILKLGNILRRRLSASKSAKVQKWETFFKRHRARCIIYNPATFWAPLGQSTAFEHLSFELNSQRQPWAIIIYVFIRDTLIDWTVMKSLDSCHLFKKTTLEQLVTLIVRKLKERIIYDFVDLK